MDNIIIRKATTDDIDSVARLHVKSWKDTYSGIVSKEHIDNMVNNIDKRIERMHNEFNLRTMIVATINNKIVGFAEYIDSNKYSSDYDVDCELCGLYIDKEYQGKGIGTKLFNYIADSFVKLGKEKMIVWCLEDNITAIRFYNLVNKGGKPEFIKEAKIGDKLYNEVGFIYNLRR